VRTSNLHASPKDYVLCAKVIGYRGVINGFKKAESVTRTGGAKEDNSITIEEITSAAGTKIFQVRKAK
jgi:hypothetical protein